MQITKEVFNIIVNDFKCYNSSGDFHDFMGWIEEKSVEYSPSSYNYESGEFIFYKKYIEIPPPPEPQKTKKYK